MARSNEIRSRRERPCATRPEATPPARSRSLLAASGERHRSMHRAITSAAASLRSSLPASGERHRPGGQFQGGREIVEILAHRERRAPRLLNSRDIDP